VVPIDPIRECFRTLLTTSRCYQTLGQSKQVLCFQFSKKLLSLWRSVLAVFQACGRVRFCLRMTSCVILGQADEQVPIWEWRRASTLQEKRSFGFLRCSLGIPRTLRIAYCRTVKAWQAAVVVTGADCPAGLSKWMTPSSLEQKLRTPVWLYTAAELPTV
jgi:hypothetical protein